MKSLAFAAAVLLSATSAMAGTVRAGFNDAQITWVDIESGLKTAAAACKPVFVLFHTDWCPHCKRYRKAFEQASIVELSKEFVFVIVDRDYEEETNNRYAPEGGYVPRSVVVNAKGALQTQITGPRDDYKYFLDPDNYRELEAFLIKAQSEFDRSACDFRGT